jgi:hypothetical protein
MATLHAIHRADWRTLAVDEPLMTSAARRRRLVHPSSSIVISLAIVLVGLLAPSACLRAGTHSSPAALTRPASPLVAPVQRDDRYVFTSGDLSLEVDPRRGARITAFSLKGRNFLRGPEASPNSHGSTFWTSPQSDWEWPPVVEIDSAPYTGGVEGGVLTLTSTVGTQLPVEVTKKFSLSARDGAVSITYTMVNRGPAPRSLAPWEITRVRVGGATFFPTGDREYGSGEFAPMVGLRRDGDYTWFAFTSGPQAADQQLFADGHGGWLAHAENDAVLVKVFPDIAPSKQAPHEGEIELYLHADPTDPGACFAEIEEQGAYATLEPGGTLSWTVTWYLRPLPPGAQPIPGNRGLADFVESLVKTPR